MSGLRKIKIDWEKLREFSPERLLTLEQELIEAIKREREERRQSRLREDKGKPRK